MFPIIKVKSTLGQGFNLGLSCLIFCCHVALSSLFKIISFLTITYMCRMHPDHSHPALPSPVPSQCNWLLSSKLALLLSHVCLPISIFSLFSVSLCACLSVCVCMHAQCSKKFKEEGSYSVAWQTHHEVWNYPLEPDGLTSRYTTGYNDNPSPRISCQ